MANRNERLTQNVTGTFYVDSSCVDCDMCRNSAPQFFKRDEESQFSFVYHQPSTPEDITNAREAMQGCPSESIGDDGLA